MGVNGPLESKVGAASGAATIAAAVVWLLGETVFHGVLPAPIEALVYWLVPGLCALAAGWATRHTWRTDPQALATRPPTLRPGPLGTDYDG